MSEHKKSHDVLLELGLGKNEPEIIESRARRDVALRSDTRAIMLAVEG